MSFLEDFATSVAHCEGREQAERPKRSGLAKLFDKGVDAVLGQLTEKLGTGLGIEDRSTMSAIHLGPITFDDLCEKR